MHLRIGLAIAFAALISGCGKSPESKREPTEDMPSNRSEEYRALLIATTQSAVKARLRDPNSAEFMNVHIVYHENSPVVCGTVNAKNGYGGMSGPQRFVGAGNTVFLEQDGVEAVNGAWDTFRC